MPRGGKGGGNKRSHKGQRRQFTNEHNLQRQEELEKKQKEWRRKQGIESDSDEEEEGEDQPARASRAAAVGDLPPSDSDDETDSDAEEKHKGVEHLIQVENPNRMGGRQTKKVTEIDKDDAKPQLSRRDREELEKQQAKANYRKLHEAGKTDEARADLARLALIRKQREETAKKREEERLAKEKANQKAQQKMMEKKGAN